MLMSVGIVYTQLWTGISARYSEPSADWLAIERDCVALALATCSGIRSVSLALALVV